MRLGRCRPIGRAVLIGVALSLACGAAPPTSQVRRDAPAGGNAVSSGPDREVGEAVALAVAEFGALGKVPEQYRVVYVENMLQGPQASPVRWRIGFKLRELIPAQANEEIGKGGDFFVEVDLSTRKVEPAKGGH